MLKLYHAPGAVCAQNVRLCLEEKGLSWQSEVVDLSDVEFESNREWEGQPWLLSTGCPLADIA